MLLLLSRDPRPGGVGGSVILLSSFFMSLSFGFSSIFDCLLPLDFLFRLCAPIFWLLLFFDVMLLAVSLYPFLFLSGYLSVYLSIYLYKS